MIFSLNLNEPLAYTEWERQKWHVWLRKHGDQALKTAAGPHGDWRFQTVGELIRHMFSAGKRYVDRLSNRPITDTASVPPDDIEALFQFGQQSRNGLKEFIESFPEHKWDVRKNFGFRIPF